MWRTSLLLRSRHPHCSLPLSHSQSKQHTSSQCTHLRRTLWAQYRLLQYISWARKKKCYCRRKKPRTGHHSSSFVQFEWQQCMRWWITFWYVCKAASDWLKSLLIQKASAKRRVLTLRFKPRPMSYECSLLQSMPCRRSKDDYMAVWALYARIEADAGKH